MKQTHILPTTMMVLAVILAGCGNATPDTNRVASETSAATADHDDHDDHAEEKADHDDHGAVSYTHLTLPTKRIV